MRWNERPAKQGPVDGEMRSRTGFLIFPKTIDGQTRWLERASWNERYQWVWTTSFSGTHWYDWVPVCWTSH